MIVEKKIEQLIAARSKASVEGNAGSLELLLAPEFTYINKWGDVLQRSDYFEKKATHGSDSYWIAQELDEMKITLLSDHIALATFRVLDHQMFEGNEMKDYVRTTYICKFNNDRWQLSFGQSSPVEPE